MEFPETICFADDLVKELAKPHDSMVCHYLHRIVIGKAASPGNGRCIEPHLRNKLHTPPKGFIIEGTECWKPIDMIGVIRMVAMPNVRRFIIIIWPIIVREQRVGREV